MAQTDTPKPEITFWPPRDYAVAHKVKSEENWWKLAELYGRTDPWDIIRFNFLTDNPLYVNYYLYKYVGCRKETLDHNNYRFSTDDSPGFIYIPRDDWRPPGALDPESEIARRTVLSVLAGANLAAVSFSYKGFMINWSLFIAVANRIIDRRITVKFDKNQGTQAEYDPDSNTMFIGFIHAAELSQRALIVHESVHAGLDLKKAGALVVLDAEVAAYVAQARYYLEFDRGTQLNDDSSKDHTWQQQIFDVAFGIAKKLKAGVNLSTVGIELLALESAVRKEPKYSSHWWKPSGYDGV